MLLDYIVWGVSGYLVDPDSKSELETRELHTLQASLNTKKKQNSFISST